MEMGWSGSGWMDPMPAYDPTPKPPASPALAHLPPAQGRDYPRRVYIDLFTPAEKAIWDACAAVEAAGAHPLLTDAVNLLAKAREKVADFVDGIEAPPA